MSLRTALPALIAVLLTLLLAAPALANPGWQCPGVCHLVTCDASECRLWRCNERGCVELASWPSDGLPPQEVAGGRRELHGRGGEASHVATCRPREGCRRCELDAHDPLMLSRFDTAEDVIRMGRDLTTSPRG